MNDPTTTAIVTGTVPLPADLPPMTVWGLRVGESRTVDTPHGPITGRVDLMLGFRFTKKGRKA
jgi:hypothetical protein